MTQPQPVAQLLITLDQARNVQVAGPIENKILCYGLLEGARDAISQYKAQPPNQIQVVRPGDRVSFTADIGRNGK